MATLPLSGSAVLTYTDTENVQTVTELWGWGTWRGIRNPKEVACPLHLHPQLRPEFVRLF